MTLSEFSAEYRIQKRTIRSLILKGLIPAIKLTAKTILFDRNAVDAALAKLTVGYY